MARRISGQRRSDLRTANWNRRSLRVRLGGHVYDRMVSDMQRHFFNQMEALLRPFSMFLPFGSKDRK